MLSQCRRTQSLFRRNLKLPWPSILDKTPGCRRTRSNEPDAAGRRGRAERVASAVAEEVRREADGPHFDSENLFETAEFYIGLAANEHRGDLNRLSSPHGWGSK